MHSRERKPYYKLDFSMWRKFAREHNPYGFTVSERDIIVKLFKQSRYDIIIPSGKNLERLQLGTLDRLGAFVEFQKYEDDYFIVYIQPLKYQSFAYLCDEFDGFLICLKEMGFPSQFKPV